MKLSEVLEQLPHPLSAIYEKHGEDAARFPTVKKWIRDQNINPLDLESEVKYPLGPIGALTTLLVVKGAITLQEAENTTKIKKQDLIDEALAWEAARGKDRRK